MPARLVASVALTIALVSALVVAPAEARRAATRVERRAIDRVLPRDLRTARCSRVVVSTVDRTYAAATARKARGCNRLGGNGYFLLERTDSGGAWFVAYTESLDIPCRLAETESTPPRAVLRDLGVCR